MPSTASAAEAAGARSAPGTNHMVRGDRWMITIAHQTAPTKGVMLTRKAWLPLSFPGCRAERLRGMQGQGPAGNPKGSARGPGVGRQRRRRVQGQGPCRESRGQCPFGSGAGRQRLLRVQRLKAFGPETCCKRSVPFEVSHRLTSDSKRLRLPSVASHDAVRRGRRKGCDGSYWVMPVAKWTGFPGRCAPRATVPATNEQEEPPRK